MLERCDLLVLRQQCLLESLDLGLRCLCTLDGSISLGAEVMEALSTEGQVIVSCDADVYVCHVPL